MIKILFALGVLANQFQTYMNDYQIANASQYSEHLMELQVDYHQNLGHIPVDVSQYDGFVAVIDCTRIGDIIYVKPVTQKVWEKFLIVDCACQCHPGTIAWMQDNNIPIEIDGQTAIRWNTVGSGIKVHILGLN